jgi:hypothetical protein
LHDIIRRPNLIMDNDDISIQCIVYTLYTISSHIYISNIPSYNVDYLFLAHSLEKKRKVLRYFILFWIPELFNCNCIFRQSLKKKDAFYKKKKT